MHVLFGDKRAVVFFYIVHLPTLYCVFLGCFLSCNWNVDVFFVRTFHDRCFFPAFGVIFLVNIVFSECCSAFLLTVFCANDS